MANEKRLIDADALMDVIRQHEYPLATQLGSIDNGMFTLGIQQAVDEAPTVDAVEVVHGRWEPHYETFDEDKAVGIRGGEYQTGWLCSVCGRYEPTEEPYCNCGAKMDGDGNDADY